MANKRLDYDRIYELVMQCRKSGLSDRQWCLDNDIVPRVAEVVQNNSAAAQETSATSEEFTAQATTLSGMVSAFKLRQYNIMKRGTFCSG